MEERKLRSGVNWQGTLQQKGVKQGLAVYKLQESGGKKSPQKYLCIRRTKSLSSLE
jgi:hypothetical protein